MDLFEFQPKPDLSSTFRNSIGGLSNIPRFDMYNFSSTQAKEIVNESMSKVDNEQFFIQNSMFDDCHKDKAHHMVIIQKQSLLRQKELSLQAKESELNQREQLLIERERNLIKQQMKFQNTQHKIISNTFLNESTSRQNRQQNRTTETKSSESDKTVWKVSYKTKTRSKKRKSILSLFGFKQSSKIQKIEDNEPEEAGISPEAQQAAMELLLMLNAKATNMLNATKENNLIV